MAVVLYSVAIVLSAIAGSAGCIIPGIERETAAAVYEAQQLACVDKYADRPSIDRCRARVKANWATDAGKDADRE